MGGGAGAHFLLSHELLLGGGLNEEDGGIGTEEDDCLIDSFLKISALQLS